MSDNFQNGQGNGFEPQNPDNSNFAPNNGAPSQDTAIRISAETTLTAFRELKT